MAGNMKKSTGSKSTNIVQSVVNGILSGFASGTKDSGNAPWIPTKPENNLNDSQNYPFSYGSGGYSGPTQEQKDALWKVPLANMNATIDNANDKIDLYKDNLDQADRSYENQVKQSRSGFASDWFKQNQKEQSVVDYLTKADGKKATSSSYQNFNDINERKDDWKDTDVLKSTNEKIIALANERDASKQSIINAMNSLIADTSLALKNYLGDTVAQEAAYKSNNSGIEINDNGEYDSWGKLDVGNEWINSHSPMTFENLYRWQPLLAREDNSQYNANSILRNQSQQKLSGSTNTVGLNALRGYEGRLKQ